MFKKENVGAINWGLVMGKTNTVFPWGSKKDTPIPAVWFHDVFWPNGTAFSNDEVKFIKKITEKGKKHTSKEKANKAKISVSMKIFS